jgi:hypothetical protein
MTEQLADLAERGAMAQHLARQSMAELMGAKGGCSGTGTQECVTNDCAHSAWPEKSANRSRGA